jgi:hypothetical protein
MLKLTCSECGITNSYNEESVAYEFDSTYIICYNCGSRINIQCETIITNTPGQAVTLPALNIGELVRITNKDHVWYNEIGIIRAKKFKHYRLEINGKLVWFPENWVESNEPHDIY